MPTDSLVSAQIVINRPIMEVFDYVADPNRLKEWVPFYSDVHPYPSSRDEYGYIRRFRAAISMRPLPVPSFGKLDTEVTDLVPGRWLAFRSVELGRTATCDFQTVAGGTLLTTRHDLWGWQAGIISYLVGPLVPATTYFLQNILTGLKLRLEGRSLPPDPKIFFSYRRKLSRYVGGRIFDRLVSEFGLGYVFRDLDSLLGGRNWAADIESALSTCQVVVVHIDDDWEKTINSLLKPRKRSSRAKAAPSDRPRDWVTWELETAFRRNQGRQHHVRVIPVLTSKKDNVSISERREELRRALPKGLLKDQLTEQDLQFIYLRSDPDFRQDFERLNAAVWDALRLHKKAPLRGPALDDHLKTGQG